MDLDTFALSPLILLPTFVFAFFLHGSLLTLQAITVSGFKPILSSYSAITLMAFFSSMLINLTFFVTLSMLDFSMWHSIWILAILDVGLLCLLFRRRTIVFFNLSNIVVLPAEKGLLALLVIMAYFMFRNGGLIDMLADSWWHMSLASRIAEDGNVFSLKQHLIGFPIKLSAFDYPFLWHSTLALISQTSGIALPVIWHAVALVTASLSLLGFYLFAFALTRNQWTSLLSALLLCLMYGGLNSYFRVSSWPGNVSYIGMYFCLYIYFTYLQNIRSTQTPRETVQHGLPYLTSFVVVAIGMGAIHGVALVLLMISIALFLYGAMVFSLLQPAFFRRAKVGHQLVLFLPILFTGVILGFLMFSKLMLATFDRFYNSSVLIYIGFLLVPAVFALILHVLRRDPGMAIRGLLLAVWAGCFTIYSIDWIHLSELFFPPDQVIGRESPKIVYVGDFQAMLPKWIHQLRGALLYSGLFSIPVSLIILWLKPDAANLFLATNAFIAGLALTSPMLFWVVTAAIQDTSSYRIQILIFHPIIYAAAIMTLSGRVKRRV